MVDVTPCVTNLRPTSDTDGQRTQRPSPNNHVEWAVGERVRHRFASHILGQTIYSYGPGSSRTDCKGAEGCRDHSGEKCGGQTQTKFIVTTSLLMRWSAAFNLCRAKDGSSSSEEDHRHADSLPAQQGERWSCPNQCLPNAAGRVSFGRSSHRSSCWYSRRTCRRR